MFAKLPAISPCAFRSMSVENRAPSASWFCLQNNLRTRTRTGATIAEFGAAFIVLVIFIFIPLINAGFVVVRYYLATGALTEYVHRLSLTEKRSQALSMLSTDTWWSDFASNCGVTVTNKQLKVIVCGANESDKLTVTNAQEIPDDWLPEGAKGPCVYTVNMEVDILVSPVFCGSNGIPGITAPVPMNIAAHSHWENLSRDPKTKEFFINE